MYSGALAAGMTAIGIVIALYAVQRGTAISADTLAVLPFQSGWTPQEHALSRYHARWYPATIVFLAFDLEMLFMYPWSVVVARIGSDALLEMSLFLATLFVPVVWAWREGALRWV